MVLQLVPTESWVRTSFRHTLFSTLLQETPEPGNPRWLCLPHSEFFPGSFTVLSCPRVSVMATPTQSPNLRVSFETSFPEGPLHPKINYHVLAENYAHWGQLGIITLAKLQKIFVKAKDSFQICINWKYHSGGLERVKKCFAHRWSFFWGGQMKENVYCLQSMVKDYKYHSLVQAWLRSKAYLFYTDISWKYSNRDTFE